MKRAAPLTFKIASEEIEFKQIHRLNYETFVEEIPQHEGNSEKILIDKFHKENTYIICLKGGWLVGMVAVRGERPFSLDAKIENLDCYIPHGRSPCEIRLLSVKKSQRSGTIFHGLMKLLYDYCKRRGYNLAMISGTTRQLSLYRHLGFVPFGPLIGTQAAKFQPMYLTLESFDARPRHSISQPRMSFAGPSHVNLLPGPVSVSRPVRQIFSEPPVSHRSETFIADFLATKQLLRGLTGSKHVEILMGSGTLANDVVAGQLSLASRRGLILSNGEFGDRLIDHANRFGLSFEVLLADWGDVFDPDDIRAMIHNRPEIRWLWAVHCETSSGMLNDMAMLKEICAERHVQLCMDCISSIGTVALDLTDVFLASGVSGKGLGAFPGLSMVFHNHKVAPAPAVLPRYIDLGYYASHSGIPFTISSNLLYALQTALTSRDFQSDMDHIAKLSTWVRAEVRQLGLSIVGSDAHASPAVITIALPSTLDSKELGRRLENAGYLLSYRSAYLLQRNWIQICLMGEQRGDAITPLLNDLGKLCRRKLLVPQRISEALA